MKRITLATLGIVWLLFQSGCSKNPVTNNYQDVSSQWVLVSSFSPVSYVYCLGVFKNYLFAVDNFNGIYRSSDNGISWTQTGLPGSIPATSLTTSGSTIFAWTNGGNGGIYRSSDNGTSWTQTELPDSIAVTVLATSGNTIFAGTDYGIYRSLDNGISWTKTGLPDTIGEVTVLATSGNTIFAGAYYNPGIYRSLDNGDSWTIVLDSVNVNGLTVNGSTIFVGLTEGVYRSTNNGTNWASTSLKESVGTLGVSGNNIFAVTNRGLYRSTDNGATWTRLSTIPFMHIIANSEYLFGCYGSEIWRLPLSALANN